MSRSAEKVFFTEKVKGEEATLMKGAGQMDPGMDLSYRVCVIN